MVKTRVGRGFLFSLLFICIPLFVRAEAVSIEIRTHVWKGKEKPAVIIDIHQRLKALRLMLKGSHGKTIEKRLGRLSKGQRKELVLNLPVAEVHLQGELEVTYLDGGTGSVPLDFMAEVVDRFDIDVPSQAVDVEGGRLKVQLSRRASRCDYQIITERGLYDSGSSTFEAHEPGILLEVGWRPPPAGEATLKIDLRCYDENEIFETGMELFPWHISVPHEDVLFASGQWVLTKEERPKLDDALKEIHAAVARYGKWLKGVRLFVAGHTDTMGAQATNQTLSYQRARAIAVYFRKHGIRIPIWVAGLGESRLSVATPDETEEAANRRAEYIIGVSEPYLAGWKKL